jgi:hypothetical protein
MDEFLTKRNFFTFKNHFRPYFILNIKNCDLKESINQFLSLVLILKKEMLVIVDTLFIIKFRLQSKILYFIKV